MIWFHNFIVNKSTRVLKIALSRIKEYPEIKDFSLSLHYFKKHLKLIKELFKENASKFK